MIAFPPCKINLGLHVIARRVDGFHNLETCFFPIPWTDILEIIPSNQTCFTSSGNAIPGDPQQNLCLRAYHLLKADFKLPEVSIHLHKVIPTGAGLGGGSSDGAYTLRLLNDQFDLQLDTEKLMRYASKLGSDCAFFIHDKPMLGTGRGEVLEPIGVNLEGKYIVVVKPPVHVSTAEAYSGVVPEPPAHNLRNTIERQSPDTWRSLLKNDFEASVFRKFPVIANIKEALYKHGAVYASMSGSGSAVFGIFDGPFTSTLPAEYTVWQGKL